MKTGYICASGLNIIATVTRGGRQLMAVTFGANSSRERGEMTAQMLFSGFAGGYRGTGRTVNSVVNQPGLLPTDMRPNVCGAGAADYSEQRAEVFSAGLDGQISYLNDTIVPPTHTIATLGRLADVPLPRPRPGSGVPAMGTGNLVDQTFSTDFGDSSIVSLMPNGGQAAISAPGP